jgi:hypothetical protein
MRTQQLHNHCAPVGEYGGRFQPLEAHMALGTMSHDDVTHVIRLSLPIWLVRSTIDEYKLSDHQIFLRERIDSNQASQDDVMTHARGRKKPIINLGQMGIRCRHCAHLPCTSSEGISCVCRLEQSQK